MTIPSPRCKICRSLFRGTHPPEDARAAVKIVRFVCLCKTHLTLAHKGHQRGYAVMGKEMGQKIDPEVEEKISRLLLENADYRSTLEQELEQYLIFRITTSWKGTLIWEEIQANPSTIARLQTSDPISAESR